MHTYSVCTTAHVQQISLTGLDVEVLSACTAMAEYASWPYTFALRWHQRDRSMGVFASAEFISAVLHLVVGRAEALQPGPAAAPCLNVEQRSEAGATLERC